MINKQSYKWGFLYQNNLKHIDFKVTKITWACAFCACKKKHDFNSCN